MVLQRACSKASTRPVDKDRGTIDVMRQCKTCSSALLTRIMEQKLKRKRYAQYVVYFQGEIKDLNLDIAQLVRKVKRCG
jgi:hypothetical protein